MVARRGREDAGAGTVRAVSAILMAAGVCAGCGWDQQELASSNASVGCGPVSQVLEKLSRYKALLSYDFKDIELKGPRTTGPFTAPQQVKDLAGRVGIIFPYYKGSLAYDCLACDDKVCQLRQGARCLVSRRRNLCPSLSGPDFFHASLTSLTDFGGTVTAVGTNRVVTAPHVLPGDYVCGRGTPGVKFVVLFDYSPGALRSGVEAHYLDWGVAPKVDALRWRYCNLPLRPDDKDPTPRENVCVDGEGSPNQESREGIVLATLTAAHGKGDVGTLKCTSNPKGRLWSYSHPLGAPLIESGPSSMAVLHGSGSKGILRTNLFLEPGSSGAPILDEAGALAGVFYQFEYNWDYCRSSGSGPDCNDVLNCPFSTACGVVRASVPMGKTCDWISEPLQPEETGDSEEYGE